MRLIDADALFKEYERTGWYDNADRDKIAEEILLQMPTIDPESLRPQGAWISRVPRHWKGKDECSRCGYHEKDHRDLSHHNYCPNCGARMGKDGDSE